MAPIVTHTPRGMLCRVDANTKEATVHTDPVCGMEVTPETAAAAWEHDGTTYYFCSVGCMERFREDPERFLRRRRTSGRMS